MTGHAAFARTLRALDADSFRASKLALLVGAVVLGAWTWWFFTPSIPEFSALADGATLTWNLWPHEVRVTHLTSQACGSTRLNQPAQLRFEGRLVRGRVVMSSSLVGQWGTTPYIVLEIPANTPPPLPTRATIEIETGRVSPATVVLRALHE